MDIKAIKELAGKHTIEELEAFATTLENDGSCTHFSAKEDLNDAMSDVLQAMEVRRLVDGGMPLQDAVRDFSKRVRGVLS